MQRVQANNIGGKCAVITNENCIYPDIDSTYTEFPYSGDRIAIPTPRHTLGLKRWSNLPSSMQGMAIHENILVRMANVGTSTTHYIYRIADNGTLTQLATFSLNTTGHSNAMQFAPVVEPGQTYPYLYVSDLTGACEVLQIAADYTVTQVQKITVPRGWQVQIGDDGFIWGLAGNATFIKYRKVKVSEGADITLTADDILEESSINETFDSSLYTWQGSKFKYGKAWIPIGTSGADKKRALLIYDLAAQRTLANIDLTGIGDVEFEDCDFWDGALIICTYGTPTYILRF